MRTRTGLNSLKVKEPKGHWKVRVIMMPTLSSLAALQAVIATTCSAASDNKVAVKTTRCHNLRCCQWQQSWHHDNSQFSMDASYCCRFWSLFRATSGVHGRPREPPVISPQETAICHLPQGSESNSQTAPDGSKDPFNTFNLYKMAEISGMRTAFLNAMLNENVWNFTAMHF